jgi:hypothetical protein
MMDDAAVMKARHALLLKGIVARLDDEFGERCQHETVYRCVDETYDQLALRSKVLQHLPALVERSARGQLRASTGICVRPLTSSQLEVVRSKHDDDTNRKRADHRRGRILARS